MNNTFGIDIIPPNDAGRIEALRRYKIYNTPSEGAFDRVAKLAARIFKVPVSLISLVEAEEVYFKANIGMGTARTTSRGVSLCSIAILDEEVTVFENALEEPCLLTNPNVAGKFGLRFYAGAPLISPDGFIIGTLCIIDQAPRPFSPEDRVILQGLAQIVMDEVELRLAALEETEKLQDINEKLEANNKELEDTQLSLNKGLDRLSASEERLRDIFQDAPVAISILRGRELVIESANTWILDIWGLDDSAIGKPMREALPELEGQPVLQLFDNVFTSGVPYYSNELKSSLKRNQQSQEKYYNVVFQPVRNEAGEVHSIMLVAAEVSELVNTRREAQELNEELYAMNEEMIATNEELSEANEALASARNQLQDLVNSLSISEAKFRNVISEAPVAIGVLKGRELIIETANAKLLSFWGRTEAVMNMALSKALPELEGQPFLQILDNVITTGEAYYNYEVPAVLNHHGVLTTIYLDLLYHPLKNEAGQTESILVVATDLTEQVKARKKVEQAEENLRIATESAELGAWSMDSQTGEFIASPRLKQIFGLEPEMEMPYDAAIEQVRSDYQPFVREAVSASMKTGEAFNIEYPIIELREGTERWVRSVGKLVRNQDAGSYLTGVLVDITEQRKDEQRKNDFIGMVSHELKTPLTSLNAYIQIVQGKAQKGGDSFTLLALERANKQVSKMTVMINGFLNLSRLESGKIHIDKTRFDLALLLREIEKETKDNISTHRFVLEPVESAFVEADQDKISQVVSNLISNAAKYSPAGSTIQITCLRDHDKAIVSVKDEGMGIRKEDLSSLFDRYYRVENQQTQTIAGFGIGLYLCSEIIQRHDGKIWVESELGKGSAFYFSLATES